MRPTPAARLTRLGAAAQERERVNPPALTEVAQEVANRANPSDSDVPSLNENQTSQ